MTSQPFALALCFRGEVESSRTWSGPPARLLASIAPLVEACETVNYELGSRASLAMRATSRLFRTHDTSRNAWFNKTIERQFENRWRALRWPPDACLFISDFCIPERLTPAAKYFVYTDAALPAIARYQSRPVRPTFVRDYRVLTRRYLDRTSMVFTMNEWTREFYIDEYDFPADRVVNVGFGINVAPFFGPKDYSRQLMLIVLRPNTEENKGLNLLLAAWPDIRAALPQAELAVVGTELESRPLGVTYYVNQPREKTVELMHEASLFVMPALCEANGIVYPEALASRTPILGLDRLAFPEFAGYGKYGFIVKEPKPALVAQKVVEALSQPSVLQRMGQGGQRFAMSNYSWDRTAKLMVDAMAEQVAASKA